MVFFVGLPFFFACGLNLQALVTTKIKPIASIPTRARILLILNDLRTKTIKHKKNTEAITSARAKASVELIFDLFALEIM